MKPAPFDYIAPQTLDEALTLLADLGEDAQPIAGGQSLVAMMALRVARPGVLVDLQKIDALQEIALTPQGLRIGATARQVEVMKHPAVLDYLPELAESLKLVGHFQTRNRGTLGGSIALGEPASENPAFALALDAELELRSAVGTRCIPATQFYTGPYMTERRDDELLVAITYRRPAGALIGIEEVMQRRGDFALTGLVACLCLEGGLVREARLAWFGMGSTPLRAPTAEAALVGADPAGIDLAELAALALHDADPHDDSHGTADYRRTAGAALFERLVGRLLKQEQDA